MLAPAAIDSRTLMFFPIFLRRSFSIPSLICLLALTAGLSAAVANPEAPRISPWAKAGAASA
jgi:hypothetical protein